ncbi:MAG: transposase, partial [Thermostichus sp. DG02_4_bins_136]
NRGGRGGFWLLSALALGDGTKVENPRFAAKSNIRKVQRQLRRKTKHSRRWKKTQKQVAKPHRKVANQRQNGVHQQATQTSNTDKQHRQATQIVSRNSLVATEMTRKAQKGGSRKQQKTGLNRSILDVGWGMLRSGIAYKLVEAGGVFVEVPSQKVKPSQTCPRCGHQQEKKPLAERTHLCQQCGYTCDRDVAAAQVMLGWALGTSVLDGEGQALPVATQVRKHCGSLRQLGSLKRQKGSAQQSG